MLPPPVATAVDRYLQLADRLVPGWLTGFSVVGSVALGGYRPRRSDIDFVAVVDGDPDARRLRHLRLLHLGAAAECGVRAVADGRSPLTGTCNGVFVRHADLHLPVSAITPVASHTGVQFSVGHGFDVNPVMWQVLAEHGIAVRGPRPETLGLDPEPAMLRQWNLDNLNSYWRGWAEAILRHQGSWRTGHLLRRIVPVRWAVSWGCLGAPRLHHTIATGQVVTKEQAGTYALETFGPQWHPIVHEALAYWREMPPTPLLDDRRHALARTAEFVLHVIESANHL